MERLSAKDFLAKAKEMTTSHLIWAADSEPYIYDGPKKFYGPDPAQTKWLDYRMFLAQYRVIIHDKARPSAYTDFGSGKDYIKPDWNAMTYAIDILIARGTHDQAEAEELINALLFGGIIMNLR